MSAMLALTSYCRLLPASAIAMPLKGTRFLSKASAIGQGEIDGWDATLYQSLEQFRRPPFDYLKSLIRWKPGMTILDLGCGPGDWTREVHRESGAESTLGVDRSEKMLALAKGCSTSGLSFKCQSIEEFWPRERYDLIMSVAAFMWVNNHATLLRRFSTALNSGGQIALDLVDNSDNPYYKLANDLFREESYISYWPAAIIASGDIVTEREYALLLEELGFTKQCVQTMIHPYYVDSWNEILNLVRATAFVFFKKVFPKTVYNEFEKKYNKCFWRYVKQNQKRFSRPFFSSKRTYIWGQKP
jgi:trans-aconitate 2-methyltransferase